MSVPATRREIMAAIEALPNLDATKDGLCDRYAALVPLLDDTTNQDAKDGLKVPFQAHNGVVHASARQRAARDQFGVYADFV